MKRTTTLAVYTLLFAVSANLPAHADQLRDGLIAFKRHDYTRAAALLRSPAEAGAPGAQAVLCYMHTYGRGVPQNYREAAS